MQQGHPPRDTCPLSSQGAHSQIQPGDGVDLPGWLRTPDLQVL